jgi:hypothetical protein
MGQRGVGPLLTAVVGDLTAGLCGEVAPPARVGGRQFTLVSRSACPPVREEQQAESPITVLDAGLDELGRKLDELARLHAIRPIRAV